MYCSCVCVTFSGQQLLEELAEKKAELRRQKGKLSEQVQKRSATLTSLEQGVTVLIKLLDPVKLKPVIIQPFMWATF